MESSLNEKIRRQVKMNSRRDFRRSFKVLCLVERSLKGYKGNRSEYRREFYDRLVKMSSKEFGE